MVLRETFLRIKSHDIHHRHTIITDKDPEIVTPTPPQFSFANTKFIYGRASSKRVVRIDLTFIKSAF